jgi:hypothetical protein
MVQLQSSMATPYIGSCFFIVLSVVQLGE